MCSDEKCAALCKGLCVKRLRNIRDALRTLGTSTLQSTLPSMPNWPRPLVGHCCWAIRSIAASV